MKAGVAHLVSMLPVGSLESSWDRFLPSTASSCPPLDLLSIVEREYVGGMDYSKIITIEPEKRSGKPCIRGMRITVSDVLEYLASGMTEEEILNDFPELTLEDIRACLAFAADREKRLAASVA